MQLNRLQCVAIQQHVWVGLSQYTHMYPYEEFIIKFFPLLQESFFIDADVESFTAFLCESGLIESHGDRYLATPKGLRFHFMNFRRTVMGFKLAPRLYIPPTAHCHFIELIPDYISWFYSRRTHEA